jgi:2,4-dienoyl-CoA reductase-like NADH-dependent reductase (Old Yellow Enzyme family)
MRTPFARKFRSAQEFRERWRELELDCDLELRGAEGPLGQPLARKGGKTIPNRFCIHPMEGWDGTPDGSPSELTLRRWRNFGRSGAGLIWGGEAYAVQHDGRANARQLFLNPEADAKGGLARLFEATRTGCAERGGDPDALLFGLQLTHSGRFARPDGPSLEPRIAFHHPLLDDRYGIAADHPLVSDDELERIRDRFVDCAVLADDVGFDFIDLKCAHGYLLHELLAARGREGRYGGSFEGRTRFLRETVEAVRAACPKLELAVRVSLVDVFPHTSVEGVGQPLGWEQHVPYRSGFGVDELDPRRFDYEEPLRFLDLVRSLGIELVNVTVGSPYWCAHLQRPAAYPPSDGYLAPRDPLEEVAQHVRVVRRAKAAFPDLIFVGSGYTFLQEWLPHVAQYEVGAGHVDSVGLGRMVLSYPELPADVLAGRALDPRRICRTFSDCTSGPRNGLISGCYPLDAHYKSLEEASTLKAIKEAARP